MSILCYSNISSYIVTPVAVFGSNHSIIACDRSNRAMPVADGVYYGPHFQTCHWCGLKIHSCGANAREPDQPIPRFILPLSLQVVKCDPVYYHANCEKRQVDIYILEMGGVISRSVSTFRKIADHRRQLWAMAGAAVRAVVLKRTWTRWRYDMCL